MSLKKSSQFLLDYSTFYLFFLISRFGLFLHLTFSTEYMTNSFFFLVVVGYQVPSLSKMALDILVSVPSWALSQSTWPMNQWPRSDSKHNFSTFWNLNQLYFYNTIVLVFNCFLEIFFFSKNGFCEHFLQVLWELKL